MSVLKIDLTDDAIIKFIIEDFISNPNCRAKHRNISLFIGHNNNETELNENIF